MSGNPSNISIFAPSIAHMHHIMYQYAYIAATATSESCNYDTMIPTPRWKPLKKGMNYAPEEHYPTYIKSRY